MECSELVKVIQKATKDEDGMYSLSDIRMLSEAIEALLDKQKVVAIGFMITNRDRTSEMTQDNISTRILDNSKGPEVGAAAINMLLHKYARAIHMFTAIGLRKPSPSSGLLAVALLQASGELINALIGENIIPDDIKNDIALKIKNLGADKL